MAALAAHERAGARVYEEVPDSRSEREKYRNKAVRNAGDTVDALDNMSTMVRDGIGVVTPTGQHATQPKGDYSAHEQQQASSSDLIVGVAAGGAMIAEVIRLARKHKKRKKDGHD